MARGITMGSFALDDVDRRILKEIIREGGVNLSDIASAIGVSKSTVHNRLKRMRDNNYLMGFFPLINSASLNRQVTAISLIRAKHGPGYAEELGKEIARIKGTWGVYFVMGQQDFVVLIRARSRNELSRIVNRLAKLKGVERSNTIMVLDILKEDPREAIRLD